MFDKIAIGFCFAMVTGGTVLIGMDQGWKTAVGLWMIAAAFIPAHRKVTSTTPEGS